MRKRLIAKSARRGMGRKRPRCSYPIRTKKPPRYLRSSRCTSYSSLTHFLQPLSHLRLLSLPPPRFPYHRPSLCAPLLHVLASPASPTRPRFRLYALAKLNAGSPDTPTSKRWRKGWETSTQGLIWRGMGEWSRGVEAVMEHHLRTVDRWSTKCTRRACTPYSTWGGCWLLLCSRHASNHHHNLHKCQRVCKDTCLTFTPSHTLRRISRSLALLLSLTLARQSSHPNFTSALMVGGMSSPQGAAESLSP